MLLAKSLVNIYRYFIIQVKKATNDRTSQVTAAFIA